MGDVLTPQAYQNNQTFDIDIEKMYRDFIIGYNDQGQKSISIDDLRSYVSVDKINDKLFDKILDSIIGEVRDKKSNASPELFSPELRVQESRCHTFFRILGFPVVGKGMRMYNPGHDITETGKANLEKKIEIARSALDNFRKLSNAREQFANSNLKIFSNQESLAASTLALSSGTSGTKNVNIRKFNTPFEKSDDPFDMDFNNQKATLDPTVIVGDNETSLTLFQDADGQFSNPRPPYDRLHIIKPFIVDPRIAFTVRNPQGTLIAVPFVPDNSYLKVGNKYAIKPLLEKIIIERFLTIDQSAKAGTSEKSMIDSIKNISSNVQAKEIIDKIASNDIYKLGDQTKFIQYVNMINALMIRLYDAVKIIHKVQSLYYWIPIPSIIGPEGGSSVRDNIISDKISRELVTQADFNIFSKQIQAKFNKIDGQASNSQGKPNGGVFAFGSSNIFQNTFNTDTTEALGDTSAATLNSLTAKRKSIIQKGNAALRTVEIIMGDFSGFGVCDILAITGALYIMPKEDLLGFLDEDALARFQKNTGIVPGSVPNIEAAMKSLLSRVKDFYNLMDSIFEDLRHNNKLPS